MTKCPPKLSGDLSKWLCEINTGVYVGNVSSRVRDALWERVCQNLKNGQATLVFTTAGEQRMDFRTHNTAWETVDFDGIKLMRRPLPQAEQNQIDLKPGFSKAAQQQMARKAGRTKPSTGNYTVIDLETTGLKAASDSIIEYGALRVRDGVPVEELTMLVCVEENVPAEITALTGLSAAELQQGTEPREALNSFLLFIGKDPLVGHNIAFDLEFLRMTCKRYGFPAPTNSQIDLTSDLVIDMSTPDQMAIATQHDDGYAASRINASGRMLINGSVLSKGGLINLDMHPGSVWTGSSLSDNVNGGKLDVAMNNSVWNVTSNSNLDTLALSHSTVDFASHGSTDGTFATLNVENLSGNSTFIMRADVVGEGNGVNNKGDLLNISGSSAGNHVLAIRNQGSEATTGNEVLTVVKTTDGAASFSASSQVELGGYL